MIDQNAAYERAVVAARETPALQGLVEEAFLHADVRTAFAAFKGSEDWARAQRLLRQMHVEPGAGIIDFGGGRGLLAAALAEAGYDVTLCEINPSPVCGTGAAQITRTETGQTFEIVDEPIATLEPESADAVICRAVLHHVEPLVPVLRDVRARLKPGGAFVASDEPTLRHQSDLEKHHATHPFVQFGVAEPAYPKAQYVDALREAGFDSVRALFPTDFAAYRRYNRVGTPAAAAALLYVRYRVRSRFWPAPGAVLSFVARAPAR